MTSILRKGWWLWGKSLPFLHQECKLVFLSFNLHLPLQLSWMIWAGPGCKGPDKREAAGDLTTAETEDNSLKREKGSKASTECDSRGWKTVSVRACRHLDLGPVKLTLDV